MLCLLRLQVELAGTQADVMESPKYRVIFEALHEEITSRRYKPGGRLPSEAELVRRFGASRMTVLKAIKELQALGLVNRRVGSGTYLATHPAAGSHVFRIVDPDFGADGDIRGDLPGDDALPQGQAAFAAMGPFRLERQ